MTRGHLRRAAIALGASTALVVVIAAFIPRAFLVNDDPGLVLGLRLGTHTPWMSQILSRGLASAYHAAPEVPWYGLYLYALIVLSGAVLIHTCIELVDAREGLGRVATLLAAGMLIGSHIVLAVGVTWTTVSMSALGTALVAFIAHVQTCEATGTRVSLLRAVLYGLLFAAGFALREAVLAAVGAALLPVIAWVGFGFLRRRRLPRLTALIAFVAPFAFVVAVQGHVPPLVQQTRGAEYAKFNDYRGLIADAAAFSHLETRAPELLEKAGWTVEEYRDFSNWLLADNTQFTTEKMRRLVETGGVPKALDAEDIVGVLRGIATDSAPTVWLFVTFILGALALAWLGVIDRQRALVFNLGYLGFLAFVPIAMSALSRFPQRVSLSFYAVAAFGTFVVLVGEITQRPPRATSEHPQRPTISLLAIALCMFVWAKNVLAWTDREPFTYHAPLRAFADRLTARNGIVMVAPGIAEMDPLLADPRGYDALPSGWGTFTAPWFEYIARFGIQTGTELLHTMVDHPNAYLVGSKWVRGIYEDWFRRRVKNPAVRLALVDWAEGMPTGAGPELYRVVTTPLVPGSDEWKLLERNYRTSMAEAPGPPEPQAAYRSIALDETHVASFSRRSSSAAIERVDGGLRFLTPATHPECDDTGGAGEFAGVRVPVNGLQAARFYIAFTNPANIVGIYIQAHAAGNRSVRWRWDFDATSMQFGFSGTITVVPGHPAHQLWLIEDNAAPRDIRELYIYIAFKAGTRANVDLRQLEVAEP